MLMIILQILKKWNYYSKYVVYFKLINVLRSRLFNYY